MSTKTPMRTIKVLAESLRQVADSPSVWMTDIDISFPASAFQYENQYVKMQHSGRSRELGEVMLQRGRGDLEWVGGRRRTVSKCFFVAPFPHLLPGLAWGVRER